MGLTVNGEKCLFRLSKLTFFSHELSSDGVDLSEEKVAAIRDARSPKDASEVRSFMGLAQYLAKFMPDVASVAKPIQKLTRKGVTFKWGEEQQTDFQDLKCLITPAETLGYIRVDCRTRIIADTSPVGPGAVFAQEQGGTWRAALYASRSLTDVERHYKHVSVRKKLCAGNGSQTLGINLFTYVKPCVQVERWVFQLKG